jgi:hypothetical protein
MGAHHVHQWVSRQRQDLLSLLRWPTTMLRSAKAQLFNHNPSSMAFGLATLGHRQAPPLAIAKAVEPLLVL